MRKPLNPFTKLIATLVLSAIIGVLSYYLFKSDALIVMIKDEGLQDVKYSTIHLQFITIIGCLICICAIHWKQN